jgi:hypothetical protein
MSPCSWDGGRSGGRGSRRESCELPRELEPSYRPASLALRRKGASAICHHYDAQFTNLV